MTRTDFEFCKEWFEKHGTLKVQLSEDGEGFVLRAIFWPRDEQPNHDNMEYVRIEIPKTEG